jgi:hypothetical protein
MIRIALIIFILFLSKLIFAQSAVQIPTVFHVLWNEPSDNIPDSLILQTLELVNKDFRRQNEDTVLTPDRFLPLAADTEIEFVLAASDPNGNLTDGITRTQTDSSVFFAEYDNMKFDSFGGIGAWNTCSYLNIWLVPDLTIFGIGLYIGGTATRPSANQEVDGIVIRHDIFDSNSLVEKRVLTQLAAQYLNLSFIGNNDCSDTDTIADTPISSWNPIGQLYGCQDTIVTCSNGVDGDMFMNFMADQYGTCKNLFTIGQKQRMHEALTIYRQGLLDESLCGLNVHESKVGLLETFPNPTQGQLYFQSSEKGNLTIFDLSGRIVLNSVAVNGRNTVDVSSLLDGIYLLQLQAANSVSSARFVKN